MLRLRFFTSGFSSARRRRLDLPSSWSSTSTCRGFAFVAASGRSGAVCLEAC